MNDNGEILHRIIQALRSAGMKSLFWPDARFLQVRGRLPIRVAINAGWTAQEKHESLLVTGEKMTTPMLSIGCRTETLKDWPRHFRRHAKKWKATKDEQHIALAALNMARALNGMKPWRAKL